MSTKSRIRFATDLYYSPSGVVSDYSANHTYESITGPVKGPGPCTHWYSSPGSYTVQYPDGSKGVRINHSHTPAGGLPLNKVRDQLVSLNWGKIPSSTEAGIIQILAEIDDTIALFTRRFWQSLSYGSFTWGVLPFVSDLIAVANAVKNLSANLSGFNYEDEIVVNISESLPHSFSGYFNSYSGTATVRKTGIADISFQHPLAINLDRLGFHPDLATAWDLIPFSFVVDYLIPIGDYLESFRQGGWVKVAIFNGWYTVKFNLTVYRNIVAIPEYPTLRYTSPGQGFRGFARWQSSDVLVVNTGASDLSLTLPSFRELFNMLYIFTRRR